MKNEKTLQDSVSLIEKALITLTEKVDRFAALQKNVEDLETEIRGLKLYLCTKHPELKERFPAIIGKVTKKA